MLFAFAFLLLFLLFRQQSTIHYPLKVGNYWLYNGTLITENQAIFGNYSIKVDSIRNVDNKIYFLIKDSSDFLTYLYPVGNNIFLIEEVEDGVSYKYDPPMLLYSFALSNWEWKGKRGTASCTNNGHFVSIVSFQNYFGTYTSFPIQNFLKCDDGFVKVTTAFFREDIGISEYSGTLQRPQQNISFLIHLYDYKIG